jgi:phosphatidylinositol alpha-1,6-mannosyltransferase
MRAPRVLLAADSLCRGASGIARVARLMARALADESRAGRLQVRALSFADAAPAADLGIAVTTAAGSRARFVAEVHARALVSDAVLYDGASMARAHPRLPGMRRPYLCWMHGIDAWEEAREVHLDRLRAADVLLVPSSHSRSRATKLHAGLEHARVCPLATEEDSAPAQASFAGEPTAVILSRIDQGGGYKGHRELIGCWPEVVNDVPNARLVIAGDGPGRAVIERLVAESPARGRIELLGFVPDSELPALWDRAWVLVMPSRGEGFGLTYVEAMRHGVPALTSVQDAGWEVVKDGMTGVSVDLERPEALGRALRDLLASGEQAARLGAAGHARWAEHYTYARFAARFAEPLRTLLACRG